LQQEGKAVNNIVRVLLLVIVGLALLVAFDGYYIVPEGQQAVVTEFGKPVGEPKVDAGFYLKKPFLQKVTYFDKKILIWDGDPNQIPTNDKTYIYLDVTARWRITNALLFLQAVNNETRAQSILDDIIDGTVRDLVNKNNLLEIIRSSDATADTLANINKEGEDETIRYGRDQITKMIHETASKMTPQYGIELVDVMFKRVNYSASVRGKVYDRMISERKRIAAEKRSQGEGLKAEIMGKVDRELKEITSKAYREAQEIKGKADAEAAKIYADAYNRDPEFYSFSKSLDAYRNAVGANTKLILSSDSEFYKFLKSSK